MAFALKYFKDKNALQIKQNGKNTANAYKKFMRFIESLPQVYQEDNFTWYIPSYFLDAYLSQFGWITTMTQTAASIRGDEKPIHPKIDYELKHVDEMKLPPYPFQRIGAEFLLSNERALITDSMGLGKTPQSLTSIFELIKEEKIEQAMVICPSAVKYQWGEEIGKFTDMTAKVVDGTKKKRKKIYEEYNDKEFQILIINYELVRTDIDQILPLNIPCITIDEAHRLKNRKSQTFKSIVQLKPKYRFGLTGTPMQNKPEEMFALMSWIDEDALGKITAFRKEHVITGEAFGRRFVDLGYKNLDDIREKTAPYLVRRTKKEVAKELPEIVESYHYCEMDKNQQHLYEAILEDKEVLEEKVKEIYETDPEADKPDFKCPEEDKLLGYQYMQQAVSDHPHLLLQGSSGLARKYTPLIQKCKKSPKLEELMDILSQYVESGSKIIIFTQYEKMLKMIKDKVLRQFNQEPFEISGEIKAIDRQKQINEFRELSDRQIMLLTDAGNYGLNLQFADVLINYELPWNPAVTQQRIGRIHRIGSTFSSVNVIHMLTKDTIDETVLKTNYKKTELNEGLVEKNNEEKEFMDKLMEGAG